MQYFDSLRLPLILYHFLINLFIDCYLYSIWLLLSLQLFFVEKLYHRSSSLPLPVLFYLLWDQNVTWTNSLFSPKEWLTFILGLSMYLGIPAWEPWTTQWWQLNLNTADANADSYQSALLTYLSRITIYPSSCSIIYK